MYPYRSLFADSIKAMLLFKERMGYSKSTHEAVLRNFDAFCAKQYPDEAVLLEEIVLAWLKKRPQENSGGLKKELIRSGSLENTWFMRSSQHRYGLKLGLYPIHTQ